MVPCQSWMTVALKVRDNPRFKGLLCELGLVDYFRGSGNWREFCKPVGQDDFKCS